MSSACTPDGKIWCRCQTAGPPAKKAETPLDELVWDSRRCGIVITVNGRPLLVQRRLATAISEDVNSIEDSERMLT